MILKYREIRNNTYISTRLIIQDCLVSQKLEIPSLVFRITTLTETYLRSLNKRIIPFPNFCNSFLRFGCLLSIYLQTFSTNLLHFSHNCGSRTWNFHHQNGVLNFHLNLYFLERYPHWLFLAWNLAISVMALFFYRHQCIVEEQYKVSHKKFIFCILLLFLVMSSLHFFTIQVSHIDPSLWPELLRKVCFLFSKKIYSFQELAKFKTIFTYSLIFKQRPEAMDLLKIPNVYYFPLFYGWEHFSSLRVSNYTYLTLKLFINLTSVLTLLGLICHMQYIFRKQCEHLTVCTQELQKKFLRTQIIQLFIYLSFDYLTYLCLKLLFKEVTDIFLTKREWLCFINSQRTIAIFRWRFPLLLFLFP
uniref:Serpentine receptor class gamma n=1 Tax=Heterorhabditis bacteriophora TaxID=37862 RepID=A0A1I7WF68_HETBA